jgi:hypothetical protein
MTEEFFDRVVAAIRAQIIAEGLDPNTLDIDADRRKVRLPVANGARFSMTRAALADLGLDPGQIADKFYQRFRSRSGL